MTGADLAGVVDALLALPPHDGSRIDTPLGPARAHATERRRRAGTLVLGHGAGGGIESADLVAVTAEAAAAGWRVVRVEQPWRVAGKRIAPAPPRLDEGWRAVLDRAARRRRARPARWCSAAAAPAPGSPAGRRPSRARPACSRWPSRCTRRAGRRRAARARAHRRRRCRSSSCRARPTPSARPEDVAAVLAGRANASVYAVPATTPSRRTCDVVAAAALSWLDELF